MTARTRKIIIASVVGYLLGGIVAYGHEAAHSQCSKEAMNPVGCENLLGLLAAVGWPLYWSQVFWENRI